MTKVFSRALLISLLVAAASSSSVSSRGYQAGDATGSATPADVLTTVELIRKNLEVIRLALGEDAAAAPILRVNNAQPAEVYSQARNLEQLAFGFAFEKTRHYRSPSAMIEGEVTPAEVQAIFDNALQAILSVNARLGVEPVNSVTAPAADTSRAEVFNAAVSAGDALNKLMKRETTPGDVFQTVSTATYLAAGLRDAIAPDSAIPAPPALIPETTSADVFARMQACFELVKELAKHRGMQTLDLDIAPQALAKVTPDDVRDLAFLIVEELHIIHQNTPGLSEPAQIYTPGEKRPAHVYQRVGLLEFILSDLVARESNQLTDNTARK